MESAPIVVAASYTLAITGFDVTNGSIVKEFEMQNSQVNRMFGIREENRLYAAGYRYVFIWDTTMKTKKPIATFQAHEGNIMDFSIHQNTLVTCGDDKLIRVWDRKTNKYINTIDTEFIPNCIRLIPGTAYIVCGDEDGNILLFEMNGSQTYIFKYKMSSRPVRSVVVSPDAKRVVAVEQSGKLACFEVGEGKLSVVYESVAHSDITVRVAMSQNGKFFATCAANNTAKLWNLENGDLVHTLVAGEDRVWIWDAAFVLNDTKVVTVGSDGSTRVFDCASGRLELSCPKADKANSCVTVL